MARKPQRAGKEVATAPSRNASRFLPLLLLLFAGSGCSALIYEIVWYQLLQLVIGSTAISLAVLLATFMGGLCLGSILLPRMDVARRNHSLKVYAGIELGIGVCGILVLFGMPLVDGLYVAAVGHGLPAIVLRAVIAGICLLPPTFLMGASLPAVARWVQSAPRGVSWMGLLYGANTAGAVFGCLLAGFYLLRVFNMASATFIAAGINFLVALVSYSLSKSTPDSVFTGSSAQAPSPVEAPPDGLVRWPVFVTIALSGACALGAEVVWTRLLSLMLGATVYAFSIILAVFLVGIGIGSGVGSLWMRSVRPQAAIGYCQIFLVAGIAWTAFMLSQSVPYWPINPLLSSNPAYTFQIDLVRVLWTIFPATLLWGASFPLALGAISSRGSDPSRTVGSVYAANSGGAILGALTFSLILIPHVGTRRCEQILISLSALAALFALLPLIWKMRAKGGAVLLAVAIGAAAYLTLKVKDVPPELIAYGRRFMLNLNRSEILYVGEGLNSSIAISRWEDGAIQFHVSGKVEASTEVYDMRLQRSLGHLAALVHPNPQSVLIVGFGAGVTAGSFVTYPGIHRIVVCEMEPLVPPTATRYFGPQNYDVMHDRRTQIVYDDARHFVLTTPEKFDIITSDPIHPWVKGSATLYSKEYFEMVKAHLNPGGVVTQWVPLYETNAETVKSEIATFFNVFPNGSVWANEIEGRGYDVFLLGQNGPTTIDVDQLQSRLDKPEYERVSRSLRDVGFANAVDLLSVYAGQDVDLRPWLAGAEINRDGNLRLQYLAGLALNNSKEAYIYSQILGYRRFPRALITGSGQNIQALMLNLRPGSHP
jgi:spermidine synthase